MDYIHQNTEVFRAWLLLSGAMVAGAIGLDALVHIVVKWVKEKLDERR